MLLAARRGGGRSSRPTGNQCLSGNGAGPGLSGWVDLFGPAVVCGAVAEIGGLADLCPRDPGAASGGYRLLQVVLRVTDLSGQVVDGQNRQGGVEVSFPLGAALLFDRFGCERVI